MQSNFDQPTPAPRLAPAMISLIVIIAIALIAGITYVVTQGNDTVSVVQTKSASTTGATDTTDSTNTTTSDATSTTSSSTYNDGSYTATASFDTPGGPESVTVTVTLVDDIVKNVSTTGSATHGDSAQYQSVFLANYESYVSGKSIDDISLSRVAGASLTSDGFNSAIAEIKRDALS